MHVCNEMCSFGNWNISYLIDIFFYFGTDLEYIFEDISVGVLNLIEEIIVYLSVVCRSHFIYFDSIEMMIIFVTENSIKSHLTSLKYSGNWNQGHVRQLPKPRLFDSVLWWPKWRLSDDPIWYFLQKSFLK